MIHGVVLSLGRVGSMECRQYVLPSKTHNTLGEIDAVRAAGGPGRVPGAGRRGAAAGRDARRAQGAFKLGSRLCTDVRGRLVCRWCRPVYSMVPTGLLNLEHSRAMHAMIYGPGMLFSPSDLPKPQPLCRCRRRSSPLSAVPRRWTACAASLGMRAAGPQRSVQMCACVIGLG